jgi:hypothetical protein
MKLKDQDLNHGVHRVQHGVTLFLYSVNYSVQLRATPWFIIKTVST